MSPSLARAPARESAAHDHRQRCTGYGPGQPQSDAVVAAFIAGAEWAEADCGVIHREEQDQWAIERSTGQSQLDDAVALIREAAETFRSSEKNYLDGAEAEAIAEPDRTLEGRDRLSRLSLNRIMAQKLESWLLPDFGSPASRASRRAMLAQAGGFKPSTRFTDQAWGGELSDDRTTIVTLAPGKASNLRPIKAGHPLGDPEVLEAVITSFEGSVEGARHRLEGVADLIAFRITTGDPRFDPAAPVCVNGYLYHPAKKEA